MPTQIRPDKKVMKLAYKILKTPKELQQKNHTKPTKRQYEQWSAYWTSYN